MMVADSGTSLSAFNVLHVYCGVIHRLSACFGISVYHWLVYYNKPALPSVYIFVTIH